MNDKIHEPISTLLVIELTDKIPAFGERKNRRENMWEPHATSPLIWMIPAYGTFSLVNCHQNTWTSQRGNLFAIF
jgi:hypothetical protein